MNIPIRGHQLATTARFRNKEHNYYLLSTQHHLMTSVNLRLPFFGGQWELRTQEEGTNRTAIQSTYLFRTHTYHNNVYLT